MLVSSEGSSGGLVSQDQVEEVIPLPQGKSTRALAEVFVSEEEVNDSLYIKHLICVYFVIVNNGLFGLQDGDSQGQGVS